MRTWLLLFLVAVASLRGQAPGGATMREKLRARILETAPPAPPAPSAGKKPEPPAAAPPVAMHPVIVTEPKVLREVATALARAEQNRKDEMFSPLGGGTIANIGPMKLGAWYSAEEGWTFLRANKPPPRRAVEEDRARLRELQELAALAENRRPASAATPTRPPSR